MKIEIDEKKVFDETLAEFLKYKPSTYFVEKCPTGIIEDIHNIIELAIHRINRKYNDGLETAIRNDKIDIKDEDKQKEEEQKQKSFFEELEKIPQEKKAKVLEKIMVK